MAYNPSISNRIREALANQPRLEEKEMFGGVCYMVNDKMCAGVMGDEMMCRIGPDAMDDAQERTGCRQMIFGGRTMKGMMLVSEEGMRNKKDFDYWIGLCLDYNQIAKSSKSKRKKK